MTPDELTEVSFECKDRWNSWGSVFKRYFDPKTHMSSLTRTLIYWMYNPVYRGENHRKQSMYFGLYNHIHAEKKTPLHHNENLPIVGDYSNINEIEFKNWNFTDSEVELEKEVAKVTDGVVDGQSI